MDVCVYQVIQDEVQTTSHSGRRLVTLDIIHCTGEMRGCEFFCVRIYTTLAHGRT